MLAKAWKRCRRESAYIMRRRATLENFLEFLSGADQHGEAYCIWSGSGVAQSLAEGSLPHPPRKGRGQVQVPPPAACAVQASGTPDWYEWVKISGRLTRPGAGSGKLVSIAAPTDSVSTNVAIPLTGLENAESTDVRRDETPVFITIRHEKLAK